MNKILILTSKYLPNPTANGINTKYIVDELKNRNYLVSCISTKGENEVGFEILEDTKIYRLEPSSYTKFLLNKSTKRNKNIIKYYSKIRNFLRKLKLIMLLPIFPNFDPIHASRVYRKLNKLYKQEQYDAIIGVFKPYSNIEALKRFKKKYPNVICIGYYLDLINSMQRPRFMPERLYDWLLMRENLSAGSLFDMSLIPIGGKKLFSATEYKSILSKIRFVDFPTFISAGKELGTSDKRSKESRTVITYAGTLDTIYRNPDMLLNTLNDVSKETGRIDLNIYGINDCNEIFAKYNSNPLFQINNFGFATHDIVINAMLESDFLVNVSNKIQDAVPSKIFELFSMGKPIINYVFDSNDITTQYFGKYPCVMNIYSWEDLNIKTMALSMFIKDYKGINYDADKIRERYIENTPGYTVDIIEEYLNLSLGVNQYGEQNRKH